jgi:hypothetical protein
MQIKGKLKEFKMKLKKILHKFESKDIPKGNFSCKAVIFYINDTIPVICDELFTFSRITKKDCRCSECNMEYKAVKKVRQL